MSASERQQALQRVERYRGAVASALAELDDLGVPAQRRGALEPSEFDELWPEYISRAKSRCDFRVVLPAVDASLVSSEISKLRQAFASSDVIWFARARDEFVAIAVNTPDLLGAPTGQLVSRARDLMIATQDLAAGAVVELNRFNDGEVYEIAAWGEFARALEAG